MSDTKADRGQLTDAMIDHIVINMTSRQRASALRDALARLRDLEADNVDLRGRLAAEGRMADPGERLAALERALTNDGRFLHVSSLVWGKEGLLERPYFVAYIRDYLGHVFYPGSYEDTSMLDALRSLAERVHASEVEAAGAPGEAVGQ